MNIFNRTNELLKNYNNLKSEIEILKLEIEYIEKNNLNIQSMEYKEKIQGTNKFNSVVENEILLKHRLKKELREKENLIRRIDISINSLSEMERTIIKLRYFSNNQYREISSIINIDESYACRIRKKAIEKISRLIFITDIIKEYNN